jgi:hypothetical protein
VRFPRLVLLLCLCRVSCQKSRALLSDIARLFCRYRNCECVHTTFDPTTTMLSFENESKFNLNINAFNGNTTNFGSKAWTLNINAFNGNTTNFGGKK